MAFHYPVSPMSSNDSLSPCSTISRHSRYSLGSIATSLKPTRQKMHQHLPRSRYSFAESDPRGWDTDELSTAIKMANVQMGSFGYPQSPISPVAQDSRHIPALVPPDDEYSYEPRYGQRFELHYEPEPFVFDSFFPAGHMPPPPPPPQHTSIFPPPPIPQPDRLAPPCPIPEVSQPVELPAELPADFPAPKVPPTHIRRAPSASRPRPSPRRQAKTPVQRIGQLERAAAKKLQDATLNRENSVRTIARQYRTLIYDEDAPEVPPLPAVHRKPLPATAAPHLHEYDSNYGPIPRQSIVETRFAGLLEEPGPPYALAPESVSDSDTLVSPLDESLYVRPLNLSVPPTPPSEDDDYFEDDYVTSPDTEVLRSQIGLEMLTLELSSAFSDRSSRAGRDASGIQIWVMIEAYERLRDQISAMESTDPELQNAREVFDSWLAALRVIQKGIADEGAESDSEYGDE